MNTEKKIEANPKKGRPPKKVKTLWEKIMAVQQEVQIVAKLGFNNHHKYKYAYERDYIDEVKPILGREGLLVLPTVLNAIEREAQTQKGQTENRATVTVQYSIINAATGEKADCVFVGQGQDATDKAIPKALTMASKYFLAKTFLIETSDDAENDTMREATGRAGTKTKVSEQQNTPEQSPGVKFERAKSLLAQLNDPNKLLEVLEGVKSSTIYTKEQKAELSKIISHKLDAIDNKAS